MNDDDLTRVLQEHASRHPAGDRLRAAVRTHIALHAATHEGGAEAAARPARVAWWRRWPAAGGFAAGVALTCAVLLLGPRWAREEALPAQLVAAHVHALQVGPLFEVASSDRHTVKPWFQGRIDYAPTVPDDLRPQGFALLGGRVQVIDGRPTAALAYQARLHMIDLFLWPSDRGSPPERLHRRGFSMVRWGDGAMQYWAVSDMDGAELERFAAAWRTAAAAPAPALRP